MGPILVKNPKKIVLLTKIARLAKSAIENPLDMGSDLQNLRKEKKKV